jgi:hypothetical protein
MKAPKTALLTAVVAIFALPTPAPAEYLVPPGNSAVNQYTESVPTAGGNRGVREGGKGGRTPAKVLGRDNAQRLEAQGEEGREAAEVAAETAPATTAVTPEPADDDEATGATAGGGAGTDDGGGSRHAVGDSARQGTGNGGTAVEVGGSSGFDEVVAQATGSSSSGQLGLLLPLILLGVVAWALAFLLRQRRQPTS